jgi:ABC-type branched-subunit amino acid transport system ATPase component
MIALEITPLRIDFPSGLALRFAEASIVLDAKQPVALMLGENGVGKTSLLNCLSGFTPISSGEIRVSGVRFSSGLTSRQAGRLGVARGFQVPLLCPELTVQENLLLPLIHSSLGRRPATQSLPGLHPIANALLGHLGSSPAELSFGQRRMVELARIELQVRTSLAKIVLLDEPLAGLDASNRQEALKFIGDLAKLGSPIVWVEHGLHSFERPSFATYVILRRSGDGTVTFDEGPSATRGGEQ